MSFDKIKCSVCPTIFEVKEEILATIRVAVSDELERDCLEDKIEQIFSEMGR